MQIARPAASLGTALKQTPRALGRGILKALGMPALIAEAFQWQYDPHDPNSLFFNNYLTEDEKATARRLYALGLSEHQINTLQYEGLLSDPAWIEASHGSHRFNTVGRSGYEVPGAAEASRRTPLPTPMTPGGSVAQPGYQPRPVITRPHQVAPPITPTHTWQDTYREVFGENYQPGLEPVRADVQAMPVAPPETMTVYSGIFRNPKHRNPNLPTNHPLYDESRGRTFRIRPVHQVLTDAANHAQSRLPTGIHASPVELGDTSLVMSKRSLPVRSPLARRM